ncbi:MAG: DUF4038 domain-containing protein [Chloroflexota bacterium]|nr:DUF4038 domain-containing protein [Chloroflexota bacterium]
MSTQSSSTPARTMREWSFRTGHQYVNPFTGVTVRATFAAPSGTVSSIEAFHDGDDTWKVRFNPNEAGTWTWRLASTPPNPDFAQSGAVEVTPAEARGFLTSTPGKAWGFAFESGEPVFIFGDTVYHLFGVAHNSANGLESVKRFMARRAAQGFNLLRIRLPVSPFHPVDGYSMWQTRSLWPWRGSEQSPLFDQFNVDYFRTVDAVVEHAESLGIGIEMIMQGWGFEFPFNSRQIFTVEWEGLWIRYLIARYDAFGSVWFWQLQNEYEYYPNGDWHYERDGVADRWAMRIGHLVRRLAPHGHVIAIHNGPVSPSFGTRFASDPEVIDTVMFQTWGTTGEHDGWLAAGIEDVIERRLGDWPGSAVLAEWGYEFNPDLPPMMLGHRWCDADHTRRGAWRGSMRGLGIIHGFENSWGPFAILDEDQPGLDHLLQVRRFFTEIVPFATLRPVAGVATGSDDRPGRGPLTLATPDRETIVVYLPTGGEMTLTSIDGAYGTEWFDPRSGELTSGPAWNSGVLSPPEPPTGDRPDDWVLVLRRR